MHLYLASLLQGSLVGSISSRSSQQRRPALIACRHPAQMFAWSRTLEMARYLRAEDLDDALLPFGFHTALGETPLYASLHTGVDVQRWRQAPCTRHIAPSLGKTP